MNVTIPDNNTCSEEKKECLVPVVLGLEEGVVTITVNGQKWQDGGKASPKVGIAYAELIK